MNIAILWESSKQGGGGGTFTELLRKELYRRGQYVESWHNADVVLIPSASVVTKETFRAIKERNIKTVLRVDNILKHSRNSGNGMARMQEFAQNSELTIFQCMWAQNLLADTIKPQATTVIYNGIDDTIFKLADHTVKNGKTYLYSCYSKGETKQWHVAYSDYIQIHKKDPDSRLIIVGNMNEELRQYNFDFYNGEKCAYLGVVTDREQMAQLYQQCDYLLAPYWQDCFSQTYLEALMCGCELYCSSQDILRSGGAGEMIDLFNTRGRSYFNQDRMVDEYIRACSEVLHGS